MRVFKTKWFVRFARQQQISDEALCESIRRAERGLIDADLGGGVIKQRIARRGAGRSGGYRSIVLFQAGERAFFVYGFPKSDRGNITSEEEKAFKELARLMLEYTEAEIKRALAEHALTEVEYEE